METKPHVCPVWIGYLLASPLRKLQQNPYKILSPYIVEGMNILEVGPAMGFFSIPLAKMTGDTGKVYCIDIQENMLERLSRRAVKAGIDHIIESRLSTADSLNTDDLKNTIDFTLLAYVVHEVPDQGKLFSSVAKTIKQNSSVLFIEPKGHVRISAWEKSLATASDKGLKFIQNIKISGSRAALLNKS